MKAPMGVAITLSTLVGLSAGYAIAHWRLSSIFAAQADAEIDEMRNYYENKYNPRDEVEEGGVEYTDTMPTAPSPMPDVHVDPDNRVEYHNVVSGLYRTPGDDLSKELVEDEEQDMLDELHEERGYAAATPDERTPTHEVITSEEMAQNIYEYDDMIYLTYHYHEDLLVDFWGNRVEPEAYIGKTPIPKPEDDDSIELCVINHETQSLVEVTVQVEPMADGVYRKNEEYIKRRFLELQEAQERNMKREREREE